MGAGRHLRRGVAVSEGQRVRYWLWVGGPVPPGAAAITLGPLIIARRAAVGRAGSERLLGHELVHVRQWRALGVERFVWQYVSAYLRLRLTGWPHWAAYRRIPLEVEAAWLARTRPVASPLPTDTATA